MSAASNDLRLTLPPSRVLCMEDRAQVERRGALSLAPGRHKVALEGISPLAVDRSLKVELTGATLVDARVVRQWREIPEGGLREDASALVRRVEAIQEAVKDLEAELGRLSARRGIAQRARADALRSMAEGAGAGRSDAEGWRATLAQLRAEEERLDEARHRLEVRSGHLAQELAQAQEASRHSERPAPELRAWVELVVESSGGEAPLAVSYLVPCAAWRPTYRASLWQGPEPRVRIACDAVLWQQTGESWDDVELQLSTARPTLGAKPPELEDDRLELRDKTTEEKKIVAVAVREEDIRTVGGGQAELPGLDDGGEVRVLCAKGRARIPSDGQPHRIAVSSFEAPAKAELLCAPERFPAPALVARFENRGAHVLLAGPVELVRGSGFVGRSQVKFAAVGEEVRLAFGGDDDLRVAREPSEQREESRLTGKRTTRHHVRLFVSNVSGKPARLAVEERIPVSEIKEVEVQLLAKQTEPKPANVTKDGIVRFELELAPREHRQLTLMYQVEAAAKVVGL